MKYHILMVAKPFTVGGNSFTLFWCKIADSFVI